MNAFLAERVDVPESAPSQMTHRADAVSVVVDSSPDQRAPLSRRRLFGAVAAVAGGSALGLVNESTAAAASLAPTATTIKKVTQYRAITYTYDAKTKVTRVTKSTKVVVTARFSGSVISLRNSKGTWVQVPYVWSAPRKALVYSRALDLVLIAKRKAATPPPATPTPKIGSTITTPSAFTSTSTYLTTDWQRHLLRRAAYGPTVDALAEVNAIGYAGWLESQLHPATIDDSACIAILSRLPDQSAPIWRVKADLDNDVRNGWEQQMSVLQDLTTRALWSKRQLLTVLEDFWGNHFNVTCPGDNIASSRAHYAYTIRQHALGTFRDLLRATSTHPSMLTYLNNRESTAAHPNENQGRELLELHTVGVDAGYGEDGVVNSARILTGLGVDSDSGEYAFQPWNHWTGAVNVLGFTNANTTDIGGQTVAFAYFDYLARHPATAHRLATKLAVRFVSDTPSATLVAALAQTYLDNDTAIVPVLRVLFSSHEFATSIGAKTYRPFEHIIATARLMQITPSTAANLDACQQIVWMAGDAGHNPYGQSFPTGQADTADAWASTASTLRRWNNTINVVAGWYPSDVNRPDLRTMLAGTVLPATHGELVDAIAHTLLGRALDADHKAAALTFIGATETKALTSSSSAVGWRLPQLVALILDSPYQTMK